MWNENFFISEDISIISNDSCIPWKLLYNKSILITGAAGMIGNLLCKSILYHSEKFHMPITVIAHIHNKTNIISFNKIKNSLKIAKLIIITGDICSNLSYNDDIHYIIHAACPTDSLFFITNPIKTIESIYLGTSNMLKLSKNKQILSFLYISSIEVYGNLNSNNVLESDSGYIDISNVRNCYPLAKKLAESLCISYYKQFGIGVKIVRPSLIFGPGVTLKDNRVFMQMAKSVINKKNIFLATNGKSERDYIYTADACRLFLSVLLKGRNAQIYNISNSDTFMSILDLAYIFKKFCSSISIYSNQNIDIDRYPENISMKLNTDKVKQLNNFSMTGIDNIVERLLLWLKSIENF